MTRIHDFLLVGTALFVVVVNFAIVYASLIKPILKGKRERKVIEPTHFPYSGNTGGSKNEK